MMVWLCWIVPTLRVLVLADDQVVGLDKTPGRHHALGLDDRRMVEVPGLLDHFLTVVVAWRRALVATVVVATVSAGTTGVVPGEGRGGDDC